MLDNNKPFVYHGKFINKDKQCKRNNNNVIQNNKFIHNDTDKHKHQNNQNVIQSDKFIHTDTDKPLNNFRDTSGIAKGNKVT